jgi:hypothetical protein
MPDRTPPVPSARWWSIADAAEYLGLAESSVRILIWREKIAHMRVGPNAGRIRLTPAACDAYLESCVCEVKTSTPFPVLAVKFKQKPVIKEESEFDKAVARRRAKRKK